jgi:hypothetical protein
MAQGSQVTKVDAVSDLSALMHNIFVGDVVENVRFESVTGSLFMDAQPGQYRLEGTNLVGAARLSFSGGAMATGGDLPDHQYVQPVNWQTTPVRRYRRIALDNHVVRRATGPGAFKDISADVFDQLWDSWGRMEGRQAVGGSNGYLGKCSSRTSSTVFVMKDAYGHAGTNPGFLIEEGMVIAWVDANAANAIKGAGIISDLSYADDTITVTMDSATTWETDGGNTLAADDYIVMATTNDIDTDYFTTEYNVAPHGVGTIVDPDDNLTTVLNISEDDNRRWRPFREASATFDHIELTEHWRKLQAKSTSAVNPQTHRCITSGAVVAELARTLEGFQQQQNGLAGEWKGGYTGVNVRGMDIAQDDYFFHNVLVTLCLEDLYRVNLGGDADLWGGDGSQFSRLADYDGVEAFAVDYMQQFSPRRNRHAALTGIGLPNVTAGDFSAVPNY